MTAVGLDLERLRAAVGWAAVLLVVLCLSAEAADSTYTSIRRAHCRPPAPELRREFTDKDLGVQECPAPQGWRLLFVASHANSWLELRRANLAWSGEHDIVYERPIGLLPNVGGSPVVEWRRDTNGRPQALIFRVMAQDPTNPDKRVSRLFVVRLGQDTACLIGRVNTSQDARTLADGPLICPGPRSGRAGDSAELDRDLSR